MEVDGPDSAAFEYAACAQPQARELGTITALIHNLLPNAQRHPCPSVDCYIEPQQFSTNPNPAHQLTSSLIWTSHQRSSQRILKNSQNGFCGFFKGIFSSVPTDVAYSAILHRWNLRSWSLGQWWNGNIYLKFLSLSSTCKILQFYGQTGQRCLKLPIWGYVHVNFISQWQCRKCIGAAVLQWAKVHGCIQCNKWYFMDTQDTDLENTRRLLLRHGQNKTLEEMAKHGPFLAQSVWIHWVTNHTTW